MAIEFGTDGWRTTVEEFTEPRIRAVGQAVADYLQGTGSGGGPEFGEDHHIALNTTKVGDPNHPLYQPSDAEPEPYLRLDEQA